MPPGKQPLVMPVGPVDSQGIITYKLHLLYCNAGIDSVDLDDPLAGDLINAAGTHALSPQLDEVELFREAVGPGDGQGLLGWYADDAGRWWRGVHK